MVTMSAENLNRTSDVIESPAVIEIPRVNVTPKIVKILVLHFLWVC